MGVYIINNHQTLCWFRRAPKFLTMTKGIINKVNNVKPLHVDEK
ncbi:unnamed protein product [Spirodela intermedia]|uniref:Uncharacterized protein n=1 Tax=Spirodela intermedia TaxID=51605 RepID=A0A7I8LBN1_SPIIN|nr:unnamed protein product [Spirodela intermedia]